ncbi:MAG: nucleotidyltransferase domain-containing protein [Patescibacteria group bacterium]|nr:nucleotidyltransferase domain-containing protein [Patescibacteria group bacterium]
MNKAELIKKLGEYFKKRDDVAFVYLFGSVAKDKAHSESDVDIGIYFKPSTRALEYETTKHYPDENKIGIDLESLIGRQTDMVVLNRAPSTLFSAVLVEGIKVYSSDDGLVSRLSSAVNDLSEDFRKFVFDFIKIKERSNSLSPNDKVRLGRLIDFVRDQMPDFKKFATVDQKQYERNIDIKRNIERWAETMATASVDISKILIASRKRPIPQTYKTILADLAFLDGFDETVAHKIAAFSDLRNLLAHEYLDLRFVLLDKFVKEGEPLYAYLINYAKGLMEKE